MAMKLLFVVFLTGLASAVPPPPNSQTSGQESSQAQQTVQLISVQPQEIPPILDQHFQPTQLLYYPVSVTQNEKPGIVNRIDFSSPYAQIPVQQVPVQQAINVPGYHYLPAHQVAAVHHAIHSPPAAPAGSNSAYVATLSYGPGYPSIVYSCYLPGVHSPPAIKADYTVKGSGGYQCAVSYHHSGNYHVVQVLGSSLKEAPEPAYQTHTDLPVAASQEFL